MNITKEIVASTGIQTALANMGSNVTIGMDDVVNAFLFKYENSLHAERTKLQTKMGVVNGLLKTLTNDVIANAQAFINAKHIMGAPTKFGLVTIESKLEDDLMIGWEQMQVQFKVCIIIKSNSISTGYCHSNSSTVKGVVPIHANLLTEYTTLMAQKAALNDKLVIVNSNLRDISRKERQVRGTIAEMKLKTTGMEDLLTEPTLLNLINDPLQS